MRTTGSDERMFPVDVLGVPRSAPPDQGPMQVRRCDEAPPPRGVGEPVKFQVAGEAGQASAPLNERPRASPEDANMNPVENHSVECSECGGDVGDLEAGDECPTCGATARTQKVGQSP